MCEEPSRHGSKAVSHQPRAPAGWSVKEVGRKGGAQGNDRAPKVVQDNSTAKQCRSRLGVLPLRVRRRFILSALPSLDLLYSVDTAGGLPPIYLVGIMLQLIFHSQLRTALPRSLRRRLNSALCTRLQTTQQFPRTPSYDRQWSDSKGNTAIPPRRHASPAQYARGTKQSMVGAYTYHTHAK